MSKVFCFPLRIKRVLITQGNMIGVAVAQCLADQMLYPANLAKTCISISGESFRIANKLLAGVSCVLADSRINARTATLTGTHGRNIDPDLAVLFVNQSDRHVLVVRFGMENRPALAARNRLG